MDTLAIVFLIVVITIAGDRILRRLPVPVARQHFTFELSDFWVHAQVTEVAEEAFEVGFVDEWSVGRTFSIYGNVLAPEDAGDGYNPPKVGGRISIKIYPMADWFDNSRMGRAKVSPSGYCEVYISMPYLLAKQLLDELRGEGAKNVSAGLKSEGEKDGSSLFGVYSFELSEALT